jgi:hypothetical protein
MPVNTVTAFSASMVNVGGEAEWYVNGTAQPFEIRTCESTDGSVVVTQLAQTINLTTALENVGGFAGIFVGTQASPRSLKSLQSSDASVTITENANDIDLTVPPSGAEVFQVDSLVSGSTNQATYQVLTILAGDPQVQNGEVWKINMCIFICHPVNVFTVNTFVEWQIETSAGVWAQFDEWQVAWPITIVPGEPSCPAHRTKKLTAQMDAPRMRVRFKLSAVIAPSTLVEEPRWGGVRIS